MGLKLSRSTHTEPQGVVILGGGITGLAASMKCGAPVYEAADRVGGVASSDTTEGFSFDRGIHILQTQNQDVIDLLDDMGVEMNVVARNAHIYSHGSYTAYPFQVNTAGLPFGLRARCVWNFLTRDRYPEPTNYEEWMYKNLGKGFAETFLIPYSEKFWGVHPREMTHRWMGDRVPRPSAGQVIRGALWNRQTKIGTNAVFRYPARGAGYGTITTELKKRAGDIHSSRRAVRLDTQSRTIDFADGESVDYRRLISTIPLPELVEIATEVPDEVRHAAEKLRTNSILVVNLGIDAPNISDKHWVHAVGEGISFFRLSYPSNFSRAVVPEGMSSISAEVAYSKNSPVDRDTIVDKVIEDLIRIRALDPAHKVVMSTTFDIKYGYCIYDMHRAEAVKTIHDWLEPLGIIPAGRYGLWTYFWSDQSLMSGIKAAEKVLGGAARGEQDEPVEQSQSKSA